MLNNCRGRGCLPRTYVEGDLGAAEEMRVLRGKECVCHEDQGLVTFVEALEGGWWVFVTRGGGGEFESGLLGAKGRPRGPPSRRAQVCSGGGSVANRAGT